MTVRLGMAECVNEGVIIFRANKCIVLCLKNTTFGLRKVLTFQPDVVTVFVIM